MTRRHVVPAALLAGLALSVPLHADPVHGEVRDLNGRPVAGAAVTVVAVLEIRPPSSPAAKLPARAPSSL